ncbi:MAG TPA: polysaccharide deacetylase family protein, partial [Nitrospiraceae bacterium]|nr:polysaccharide deacetylase family protein [Nitrospiraceae bacterium]
MQTLRGRLIIGMTIILSAVMLLNWLRSHPGSRTITVPTDAMYVFQGVTGPDGVTSVQAPPATSWNQSAEGSPARLAVLLTDPSSAWLGLVHGLKTIGIPFIITQDYAEALTHHVVLVYPEISGVVLTPEALQALAAFPRSGGTLIGSQVLGGGLQEVFGFREAVPSRQRFEVRFDSNAPFVSSLADPGERRLRLGNRTKHPDAFGSYGYTQSAGPLARYEDGTAAVTYRSQGKGHAYAVGIDLGALLLKGYNNRGEEMTWSYDNRFDPSLDVWLRFLKDVYTAGEPDAVTVGTVPFGRSLSVMVTHDVDFTQSMANAVTYAEYEKSQDVVGTYFIQTKYIRDYNDDIFFDHQGIVHLKKLAKLGMEIGSHTVAHSKLFARFPMGTGTEQYPTYTPFVKDRNTTSNGTILGELRVSKFLLEHFSDQTLMSFRPGELSNPGALPQALQAVGYRYSSSTTANNSLTHLPYQLNYDRLHDAEMDVFEFPVTVEDEELPKLGERLSQAVELAHQISRYGGSFVLLIHPNILDHKLEFEKRFVESVKSFAWFGSVSQFGQWWAARNDMAVDVAAEGETYV